MKIRQWMKYKHKEEEFYPSTFSFFSSPYFIVRRLLLRSIREDIGKFDGDILDFGCGSKPYERLFVSATSYTGVDVKISGHDHSSSNVDVFYEGNTLPFDDNCFDNIVCFEVFEHVDQIEVMIKELFRVVRPGGKILVTTPFIFPEHETPYDFRRFTRYGLSRKLEEGGFRTMSVKPIGGSFATLAQTISHHCFSTAPNNFFAKAVLHLGISVPFAALASILGNGSENATLYLGLKAIGMKPIE